MRCFTKAEIMIELRGLLREKGSMQALANYFELSRVGLYKIFQGKENPGPRILIKMGLKRVIHYVYLEEDS